MIRFSYSSLEDDSTGRLVVQKQSPDFAEVFHTPPEREIGQFPPTRLSATEHLARILIIDRKNQRLTIFPINTRSGHPDFLKQKYEQIERITLENRRYEFHDISSLEYDEIIDILEYLPKVFVKDYRYGLGLKRPYRFIIDAVESLSGCTEIVISGRKQTGIDERKNSFYISSYDLENIRKSINRVADIGQTAARSVNSDTTHNFFAEKLGKNPIPIRAGRSPLRRWITEMALKGEYALSRDEQDIVISALAKNTKSIAENRPEKLAILQMDIELVTLDALIERYEKMFESRISEGKWQVFFNENPFILSLAFGYPVIKVREQASVGGRKLSGTGEKIADFLVKNSMTNNSAIVEIKTPRAKLLNARPRRSDVYTPSGDLVGAINQALEQKYQFEKGIAQIKENSRMYDIESYSVHCCLIIGTMPSDIDRQRSFELFRRNSKDVEITTYDELLKKLKQLRDFLKSPEVESVNQPQPIEPLL